LALSHLCSYLEFNANRFPERPAALDPDGTTLSYREFNDRANRIAGYLLDQGVLPGDRVGVVVPKTTMALTIIFGIMKARAAYVPIDWTTPAERISQILASCQVRVVFADPRSTGLDSTGSKLVPLDASSFGNILSHDPISGVLPGRSTDDLAHILYTSGSSGIPKGAMLTHGNLTSFVDWCAEMFGGSEEDRFGNHAPFNFAISVFDVFVPIKLGASVHLVPSDFGKNPRQLAHLIADRKLTVWYSTPAILRLLAEFGELDRLDFSSLRLVLFAGEPFQIPALRRLMELWTKPSFFNLWGSTETNACTFAAVPRPIPDDRTLPYPIGKAGSHCQARLFDEGGNPVAPGQEGLLHIAGAPVFIGYWGLEASNFTVRDGIKWHNTGDIVREVKGEGFVYVGRRDRMVKRRGFRIELAEVERCLFRHPNVAEVAVIALSDSEAGKRILAVLVARTETRPSIIELKMFCNQNLPDYMNPDDFVFSSSIPRTSSNKIDYQTLIRQHQTAAGA
jgi:amino acid adenylation domain-containing protein